MSTLATSNLARLAESAFERQGDYPSLMFDGRWHRSGELLERSRHVAGGLVALGVAPGDRVVVCMSNCPEVNIVYQALWRIGAIITPVMFVLPAPELRHVVADAEACAVITTSEFVGKVREAVAGLESVRSVICHGEADDDVISFSSLEQAEPSPIVDRAEDDLAALLYTGGTTGRAKGVMLSHANLFFTSHSAHDDASSHDVTRTLVTLPLSHSFGLLVTLLPMHSKEREVTVLLPRFDPAVFLGLIEKHRIQLSAVVPSMIQLLLGQPIERYDLSSLRYLVSGAAPLPRATAEEMKRRAPSVTIREGYGLTETAAVISINPSGRPKTGSVGTPSAGATVAILDEAGHELPPGEPGEICCRSPAVMLGYWHSPEATAEALRDGWLHTGDLGYLDEDGYLFIVGRVKELIIRGGFNVYPRDVEDALTEHPAVEQVAVVGRPDEIYGEEIVAFVTLAHPDSITSEELIEWARGRIGGYKYPREVHFVETLPLTAVGKLDRKVLRSRLTEPA